MNVSKFFTSQTDGRPVSICRITIGALSLIRILELSRLQDFLFNERAWLPASIVAAHRAPYSWSVLDVLQSPFAVNMFFIFAGLAALFMTLGLFTKISTLLTWIALISLQNRNPGVSYGGDEVLMVFALLLMFANTSAYYSLDRLIFPRENRRTGTAVIYLMQMQVAVIYLGSAIDKFHGEVWRSGHALAYILVDPAVARFDMASQLHRPLVLLMSVVACYGALAFELLFPLLIWFRRWRRPMLLAGVVFHVAIFMMIDVGWFSQVMLATYAVFLGEIPHEDWCSV